MFRALDRGDIKFMWIQVTNPMVTMPNLKRYRNGALKEDRFIVVSDVYPTPTTDVADVILPAAMWVEKEGLVRQLGAAHPALGPDGRSAGRGDVRHLAAHRGRQTPWF
jgi:anaerobic selenocysteine-containing dehydrogenase